MIWPKKLAFALSVGAVLAPLSGYFAVLLYPETWPLFFINVYLLVVMVVMEGSSEAVRASTIVASPLYIPAVLGAKLAWPTTLIVLPLAAMALRNRPVALYILSPLVGLPAALATIHYFHGFDETASLYLERMGGNPRFDLMVGVTGFFCGAAFGRAMYENTR